MDYYDEEDPMTLFRDAYPNKGTRAKSERRLAQFFRYIEFRSKNYRPQIGKKNY